MLWISAQAGRSVGDANNIQTPRQRAHPICVENSRNGAHAVAREDLKQRRLIVESSVGDLRDDLGTQER